MFCTEHETIYYTIYNIIICSVLYNIINDNMDDNNRRVNMPLYLYPYNVAFNKTIIIIDMNGVT